MGAPMSWGVGKKAVMSRNRRRTSWSAYRHQGLAILGEIRVSLTIKVSSVTMAALAAHDSFLTNTLTRQTVPTELAALTACVSPATIRKWASREKLTRYGSQGRAEYGLDGLMALARTRSP